MAGGTQRRRRSLRELLRDTAGHATAEAVIMIPFFVIVWGCILYVAQGYERAIDVGADTREHAWAHVMDECDRPAPGGTEVTDATNPPLGPLGDLLGMIDEIIGHIPFFEDYWPGFIVEERQFVRRDRVDKPSVIGGGEARIGHTIVLMCNEEPRGSHLSDMADEAWLIFGM